jgi:hypothetical protein
MGKLAQPRLCGQLAQEAHLRHQSVEEHAPRTRAEVFNAEDVHARV